MIAAIFSNHVNFYFAFSWLSVLIPGLTGKCERYNATGLLSSPVGKYFIPCTCIFLNVVFCIQHSVFPTGRDDRYTMQPAFCLLACRFLLRWYSLFWPILNSLLALIFVLADIDLL